MTGFFPNTSFFPCQYHSTNVKYSYFIHLPSTLHNLKIDSEVKKHVFQTYTTVLATDCKDAVHALFVLAKMSDKCN